MYRDGAPVVRSGDRFEAIETAALSAAAERSAGAAVSLEVQNAAGELEGWSHETAERLFETWRSSRRVAPALTRV